MQHTHKTTNITTNNKYHHHFIDTGHSDAVLSFDLSQVTDVRNILCTSSYDHSIRIYDLHNEQPISHMNVSSTSDISHVRLYSNSSSQYIYAIIGNCVHIYDLRNISRELFILKCFEENEQDDDNELNSLDIVGENACTCDDDGNIYIFSNQLNGSEMKIKKVLTHSHENICMNVKLRPNTSCEGMFEQRGEFYSSSFS